MSHTAYKVTLKKSPRARKSYSWILFGESAELVASRLRDSVRRGMPELVILAVEPTADPRGTKVRDLAERATVLMGTPRRPMVKCDTLSPADHPISS